ncbi:MAG TPA: OmpH family outer membrane protein [Humisphaera sp.]
MNQPIRRSAARVSSVAVAALGLAAAAWSAGVGCDKKASTDAPAGGGQPGGGQATAAPAGKAAIGVIDTEKVMADLGWDRDRKTKFDAANNELGIQRKAFVDQLGVIIKQRRESLFSEAKFNADHIAKLDKGEDIDKLPWTNQQRDQYVLFSQQMSQVLKGAEQRHGQLLQQWLNDANRTYVTLMQPGIRRAAEANGVTVVLPAGATLFSADSVNITNRVVDDLKAVKPDNLPPIPKFDMQIQMNEATTQPTTAPSTPGGSGKPTTKSK